MSIITPKKLCVVDDCKNDAKCKGMCSKHYSAYRRSKIDYGTCIICGCKLGAKSVSGLCRACNCRKIAKDRSVEPNTCDECGKELVNRASTRCLACNAAYMKINPPNPKGTKKGVENPSWRGGRYKTPFGYVMCKAPSKYSVNKKGYILEHRLVMEKHLNRRLTRTEVVHHINGIKDDNRIENLQVMTQSEHLKLHAGG